MGISVNLCTICIHCSNLQTWGYFFASDSMKKGTSLSSLNFCRAMLCKSAAYAVMRCLSVRPSVRHVRVFCQNEWTYSQFFHHSSFSTPSVMVRFRLRPPNRDVECRWGIKNNHYHIASSRVVNAAISGVINTAPPDRGKLMTHYAGSSKRRSLLIAGDGHRSVYDKKP